MVALTTIADIDVEVERLIKTTAAAVVFFGQKKPPMGGTGGDKVFDDFHAIHHYFCYCRASKLLLLRVLRNV